MLVPENSLSASVVQTLAARAPAVASPPFARWLSSWLMGPKVQSLYDDVRQLAEDMPFFGALLQSMGVCLDVSPSDVKKIPAQGALVVTANHPFGLLDAAAMCHLVHSVRPDFKVLANPWLNRIQELAPFIIPIDPWGGPHAKADNQRSLRCALSHLQEGGTVLVFPAGEVSAARFGQLGVQDLPWRGSAGRLAQKSGAAVLPAFVAGRNSMTFQLLGLLHPMLRTLRLPAELLRQRGTNVHVRLGTAYHVSETCPRAQLATSMRARTYVLGARGRKVTRRAQPPSHALGAAASPGCVHAEIQSLPPESLIFEGSTFSIYSAPGHALNHTMQALGHAREMTFRQVGEGTGAAYDVDCFDTRYQHLLLWHKPSASLAGSYRFTRVGGQCPTQASASGALYTETLFTYDRAFYTALGPAIEAGRSFIVPAHQRHPAALASLWQGIARHIGFNPWAPTLLGAVSISDTYSDAARALMATYLAAHHSAPELAPLVHAKTPIVPPRLRHFDAAQLCATVGNIAELSALVADLEPDGKGVPVLLQKYLKLGGRVVGFNLDRHFGNALDALMVIDLRQAPQRLVERMMGEDSYRRFAVHHGLGLAQSA